MTTIYELGNMKPTLPENNDFWIAPSAFVIGNVIMKEGTSVWFGTTIRGDNETVTIMDGTNIQENTVLHTDLGFPIEIGKNCTIGHKAMLHGYEEKIESGAVVFISCGPLARVLVKEWFQKRPDVTFIDIGSTFDPFTRNVRHRCHTGWENGFNDVPRCVQCN